MKGLFAIDEIDFCGGVVFQPDSEQFYLVLNQRRCENGITKETVDLQTSSEFNNLIHTQGMSANLHKLQYVRDRGVFEYLGQQLKRKLLSEVRHRVFW